MFSTNGGGDNTDRQLRQACAELVRQLRAGQPCHAEDFLTSLPASTSDDESVLELIYTEYVVREGLGQHPDPAEWYARFPQWRERLERLFHVGELMRAESGSEVATVFFTPPLCPTNGAALANAAAPWLDHYELLDKLGRGGMGVVYKARQIGLNRVVALKMIKAGGDAGPDELARFRREAESMARLMHPNIVAVHAIGECDGLPCFSMEFVEGGNLAKRIAGQPQPARQAAVWMEALAQAVHYAHQQNLVHRDLKPSNVVLSADGVPKITDFGLAKRLEADASHSRGDAVIGTPGYNAPEQAAGRTKEIGPLSDVYSLGAILYELLVGQPPFRGATPQETLRLTQEQEPPPPRAHHPGVDPELEAVCLKCLEKQPQRRYASAAALADDLGRWLCGKPTLARPRRWPTRAWRFVRRHPRLSAAAALLLIAAVAVPVIKYFQDPIRQLEKIQRELAAGQAVTLLAEAGQPLWFQPATDEADMRIFTAPDGTFSVESRKTALVELLPRVPIDRYRFIAEVRHDEWYGYPDGEVGIYFRCSKHDTAQGETAHFFCALSFNDQRAYNTEIARRLPKIAQKGNPVHLNLRRYIESTDGLSGLNISKFSGLREYFPPLAEAGRKGPYRRIAVRVAPESTQVFWEDRLIEGEQSRVQPEKFTELSRVKLMEFAKSRKVEPLRSTDGSPEFAPQGALGLYVCRGAASFRLVAVEPRAGDN